MLTYINTDSYNADFVVNAAVLFYDSRAVVADSAKSRAPERSGLLPPGQPVSAAAAGAGASELQGLQSLPTGSLNLQGPQGAQDQGRRRVPGQPREALRGDVPVSVQGGCGGGWGRREGLVVESGVW